MPALRSRMMDVRRNEIWPFLLVLSVILYVYRIPVFDINVTFFRILYVFWLLILLADLTLHRISLRRSYALYFVMFFGVVLLNGLDLSRLSNVARYGRDVVGHLINVSLVGLIILYFNTEQKIERLIRIFSLSSLFALAIALFSAYTGRIPFEDVILAEKTQFVVQDQFAIYSHGFLRLASSFYDPNFYGLYLCFVVVFCFYLIYFHRVRWIYKAILLSAVAAIVLTMSRTSFVGLSIILLISVIKMRRTWGLIGFLACTALAGLFVFVLFSPYLAPERNFLEGLSDPASVIDRFNYIQNGLEAFDRNFLFGSGTEGLVSRVNANASAHIVYLSWLAKYGLVGFALYASFLFYPLVYVYMRGRRLRAKYRYLIVAIYSALVVMYLAYDYFAFLEFEYLVFGIVYSIILNRMGLEGGSIEDNTRNMAPVRHAA